MERGDTIVYVRVSVFKLVSIVVDITSLWFIPSPLAQQNKQRRSSGDRVSEPYH